MTYGSLIKLQIIVDMENALKRGPLTVDLLTEAKRIEFPDNVIGETDRKDRSRDQGTCVTNMELHAAFQDG